MYCHDLEVMSSNPGWVELGVHSTSAPKLYLNQIYLGFACRKVKLSLCFIDLAAFVDRALQWEFTASIFLSAQFLSLVCEDSKPQGRHVS